MDVNLQNTEQIKANAPTKATVKVAKMIYAAALDPPSECIHSHATLAYNQGVRDVIKSLEDWSLGKLGEAVSEEDDYDNQ